MLLAVLARRRPCFLFVFLSFFVRPCRPCLPLRPLPAAVLLPALARVCAFSLLLAKDDLTAGDETGVLPGTFYGLIGAMGRLRLLAVVVVEAQKSLPSLALQPSH